MGGVALRGLCKRFGGHLVLDNLSLDIGAHEFLVVLGPSGCGKSTLLRAIAGLESIDSGTIEIGGTRVDHLPPGRRGVAMVFQGYALYPHMTVRENISFGLRNARVARPEIDRRIAEVARMLELESLLDRLPAELSGGQRQRVAIGRAIVKDPEVFMFDEPLSNLDAALRSRTRQEIANLHRRLDATMIFVTHDQTEAMTLADRIVVMNQQRIEQIGTPLDIYARPATEFVATFVGSPAMNILPAALAPFPAEGCRIGIRPESLTLRNPGKGHTDAAVEFVEFLGDKSHIHLSLPSGERLVASTSALCAARPGDTVGLEFDRSAIHCFDANGRSLR
jgi:multiple sugar transport system ATP-binding protein